MSGKNPLSRQKVIVVNLILKSRVEFVFVLISSAFFRFKIVACVTFQNVMIFGSFKYFLVISGCSGKVFVIALKLKCDKHKLAFFGAICLLCVKCVSPVFVSPPKPLIHVE